MSANAATIAIAVQVTDLPIGRALAEEHRAAGAYFMARLLLVDADNEHKAYSDLIAAHDAVADLIAEARDACDDPLTPDELAHIGARKKLREEIDKGRIKVDSEADTAIADVELDEPAEGED